MNNLNQFQIVILGSSKLKTATVNKLICQDEKENKYEIAEIQTWISNKENLLKLKLDSTSTLETLIISVRPDLNQFIPARENIHFFDNQKAIDYLQLKNIYTGFGADRLAALLGGISIYPNNSFAIIDLGTCNTFSVLRFDEHSQSYELKNSGIAPGITTSLLSLHEKTASLPLLTKDDFQNYCAELNLNKTPNSTRDSICEGVLIQTIGFIEKIEKLLFQMNSNKSQLIITGGWSEVIGRILQNQNKSQNNIFTNFLVEPNLCFFGAIKYLNYCKS
jgi:pantothenate kinase type III